MSSQRLVHHYKVIRNLKIRYIDCGNGTPLLLIHGIGGSIDSWKQNIIPLSKKLRIIALDLPGFGFSDKPSIQYSIRFFTQILSEFISSLGINALHIAGSSFGGQLAAEMAIRHPHRVLNLILVSPAGTMPFNFRPPGVIRYMELFKANNIDKVKQSLYFIDSKDVTTQYAIQTQMKFINKNAKHAFLSAFNSSSNAPRLYSRLDKIKCKVLLIWGKKDQIIPVVYCKPFIEMKSSRVVLLEDSAHRPYVDNPTLFNKLVFDFLVQ